MIDTKPNRHGREVPPSVPDLFVRTNTRTRNRNCSIKFRTRATSTFGARIVRARSTDIPVPVDACVQPCMAGGAVSWRGVLALARRGAAGACAGAVLLTTCVMAALEPCLPLWIVHKFHAQRWVTGAVFVPDSAGYLLAASLLGGAARRLGAERVALAGQLGVALAALAVPHAVSVPWLALPHALLGAGLGAADAALVPALLARHPQRAPHVAALLQAASSAAYALGPVVGGAVAWCVGFETALRALGVLNLLYLACLYRALVRHPLSEQWGASSPDDDSEEEDAPAEATPLAPVAARAALAGPAAVLSH